MMTKDEALKMVNQVLDDKHHYPDEDIPTLVMDALNACKEALEQPAQEPVAWLSTDSKANEMIKTYQWQGLTDDELEELSSEEELMFWGFARAIKAKLKEKNNAM